MGRPPSAPSHVMAMAKHTTFLVIIVVIGNKMANLRSREIVTKLNSEAAMDPTWAQWKNLHNTANSIPDSYIINRSFKNFKNNRKLNLSGLLWQ